MRCASVVFSLALLAACSSSPKASDENRGPTPFVITTSTADGKSAFVGTFSAVAPGVRQTNADSFEVAGFSFSFVRKRRVITVQNANADAVPSFTVRDDGRLEKGPVYTAPTASYPAFIYWLDDDRALLSLADAGKIVELDTRTMSVTSEIDVNGAEYVKGFEDGTDLNPNPTSMVVRDGKLFVALWQEKMTFVPRENGVAMMVIDLATKKIEKYVVDTRGLSGAGRPGEINAMFVDEQNDIYLYCSGGFGANPNQHHGFLRIKAGSTDFDPTYLYDMTAEDVELPSRHSDFANSFRYYKSGVWFASLDDFSLNTNPPDYINTYTYAVAKVDLYNKKTTILPFPYSNGNTGGAMEIDGDTLIVSLATKDKGAGLFTFDIPSSKPSEAAVVAVEGYPQVIRKVRP